MKSKRGRRINIIPKWMVLIQEIAYIDWSPVEFPKGVNEYDVCMETTVYEHGFLETKSLL